MIRSTNIFSILRLSAVVLLLSLAAAAASEFRERIVLQPGETVYPLEKDLITVDSVGAAGERRFLVDELYGRLILLEAPRETDTLIVHYRYSDAEAPGKLDLGIGRISEWFPEAAAPAASSAGELSSVDTRGSVSRRIEVGSTGQSLLSGGVDLKISGELSPGIRIRGIISDNDAPFEEYASTQSVQDVDKVLIDIYSDSFSSQIGDVYVNSERSYWSRFQRKLLGVRGEYRSESYAFGAFAGSARGRFERQEIDAREADQGPYRLRADNGDNAIMIVPQSEHIYIDGVELDRTQYTLYYRDAELFFSPGILISENSRIVAEFNYVNEFYARASAGTHASWRPGKNIRLQASFIREKDDENSPLDVHLDNIPRDSLSRIVSDDGYFTLSTAVADTAGDYVREGDIWTYAGEGAGTHTVYFYRENRNGGYVRKYDTAGKMYYSYAPEDPLSQYFPRRKISLPLTQWTGTLDLELGQQGKAHALLESAYSGFDPNNYNTQTRLSAPALRWTAELPFGKVFRLRSEGWLKDPDFRSFSRLTRPDHERYLGFSPADTLLREAAVSAETVHPSLNTSTSLEYAEDTRARRRTRLLMNGSGDIRGAQYRYRWSQLLGPGLLPYYSLQSSLNIPAGESLAFSGSFMREHFEPVFAAVSPYRAGSAGAGISWKDWKIDYTWRRDYDWHPADSLFQAYSTKHDLALRADQSFFDKRMDGEATATYRLDDRGETSDHYLLTGSRLGFRFPKAGLNGSVKTNINRSSETKREAVFIYVGEGLGNYRLDDYGQYVPDDLGSFIMRTELSNKRQDQYVTRLGSSLNWKRDLKKLRLGFSHSASSELRTPELRLYAKTDIDAPDTSVYYGSLRFRHEFRLGNKEGDRQLLLLLEDAAGQNFQTAYNENVHRNTARWLKYRSKHEDLVLELYYKYASRQQHRMPLNSYRIRTSSHTGGSEVEYLFSKELRTTAELEYTRVRTDFRETFITHWVSLRSQWIWYRVAGERFFLSAGADRVVTSYAGKLPYETAGGLPAGWSWSGAFRFEKSINRYLSASTFLQFRKRAGQRRILTANLEIKAYF